MEVVDEGIKREKRDGKVFFLRKSRSDAETEGPLCGRAVGLLRPAKCQRGFSLALAEKHGKQVKVVVNQALGKKNIGGIPEKDKNSANARYVYGKVLKNFKNRKTIQDCAQYHYGFNELVKQLEAIQG